MIRMILSVAFALSIPASALAQTLTLMKSIDAPHYDAQRTTWGPTSDIVNMFQDTLVALDWDGRTPVPYLAKSWTVSSDGKTYTFKLRDDVSFCSGKKFTAEEADTLGAEAQRQAEAIAGQVTQAAQQLQIELQEA